MVWVVFVLLVAGLLSADASFPLPGEWPCDRGNARQDARALVQGRLDQPRVVWRQWVGRREAYLSWQAGGDDAEVTLDPAQLPAEAGSAASPEWSPPLPMGQVAGQLQALPTAGDTIYLDALPERPGLEKVSFESGFSIATVNGQWQPAAAHCFAWEDGEWRQVWQTPRIDMLFAAQPVFGDFDADGETEIAFLPWYELIILNARTGAIEDRCRFTEGRSYGFLGAYDLDADGKSELLVMADFCKHVDVLGYREGKLSLLWQREIETSISNPQKVLQVTPCPAADVDGDGRLEVIFSLFSDAGDGRWHLNVHDGLTGALKADLPDEFLEGVYDVDQDGVAELLTVRAVGAGVPQRGHLGVWSLHGITPRRLWEQSDAAWATWDVPVPGHTNNCATQGKRAAMARVCRGRFVAVARASAGRTGLDRVSVLAWEGGGFRRLGGVEGPGIEPAGLNADGDLLVRCPAAGAPRVLKGHGGSLAFIGTREASFAAGSVIVAHEHGRPQVLVQGSGEDMVVLEEAEDGASATELGRFPGRGQSTNWPGEQRGPVVADLRGDGGRQVLYATASPEGCARLVARELGGEADALGPVVPGEPAWYHDFPEIPGSAPVWNTGGLILWQVGHFTDPRRMDVLFTVRRSMMHSEETGLLSGEDGRELWRRKRQIEDRGVGGTPFAVADFDGDGLDDAASLHPSILYILRGATGEDVLARSAVWPEVRDTPIYWGLPVAGEFEGPGRLGIFLATTRASLTALLRTDGSLAWADAPDVSPQALPALGDVDGDGRLEMIGVGYPEGIRCYDVATGAAKWSLASPAPGVPPGMASADLNADGRDEVVFSLGTTLYCLAATADGASSQLLWQLGLPATLSAPTIADVSGTGEASVLLTGADGFVYCVR